MPIKDITVFQLKKYKYNWKQFTNKLMLAAGSTLVFVLLCCFFFVLVSSLKIFILKHALQLNYYFQVDDASQCFFTSPICNTQTVWGILFTSKTFILCNSTRPLHWPRFPFACAEFPGMDTLSKNKLHTTPKH